MAKLKRPELAAEAARINLEVLARLGGELRIARHRRRLTQEQLGGRAGLSRSAISTIERGRGGSHTLDTWQRLALAVGGDRPHRIASCWVARDVERNRQLLARYPELFASKFPGSSALWVRALTGPAAPGVRHEPPVDLGLVWCDARATRLFPWRRAAADRRPLGIRT